MSIDTLLDFIAEPESESAARRLGISPLDVVWGGINSKDRPERRAKKWLSQMKIREVLAWQDSIDAKYQSEAAGKWQIMEDTLRGLYAEAGLSLDNLYDAAGQRALALQLLKRRGLKSYLAGTMSANDFANNLAKEWASLPVVTGAKMGRSYYSGDGLNKSHVSVEAFLAAVQAAKPYVRKPAVFEHNDSVMSTNGENANTSPPKSAPASTSAETPLWQLPYGNSLADFIAGVIAAITRIFGRK